MNMRPLGFYPFQAAAGPPALPYDPFFDRVVLLQHYDGNLTDVRGHPFTATGGAATSATEKKFGTQSLKLALASGQYISTVANADFVFGTSPFTVEAWVYATSAGSGGATIVSNQFGTSGSDNAFRFYLTSADRKLGFHTWNVTMLTGVTALALNTWHHVAVSFDGTTYRMFLNGVLETTFATVQNLTAPSALNIGFSAVTSLPHYWDGYIDDVRITRACRYTANFTPPSAAYPERGDSGAADGAWGSVVCLLHGDGTAGKANGVFLDSSPTGAAITPTGSAYQGSVSPFATAGGSAYLDGASYLSVAGNAAFAYGTGDWTLECWVKFANVAATQNIVDQWPTLTGSGHTVGQWSLYIEGGTLKFIIATGSTTYTSASGGTKPTPGVWHHIAVVRVAGTFTVYLDGAQLSQAAHAGQFGLTSSITLGALTYDKTSPFTGHLSDVRISNVARYTAPFTPPTAPTGSDANTRLLCSFTNAGIVDSARRVNLRTDGDAKVSATKSKFGGSSMVFDAVGDALAMAGADFAFGLDDFTIEFWINANDVTTLGVIFDTRSAQASLGVALYVNGGSIVFMTGGSGRLSGAGLVVGQWHHVALVRNGAAGSKLYLDGVLATASGSNYADSAQSYVAATTVLIGSAFDGTARFNGYIDDFRVTRGVPRYLANFPVPTAAFPDAPVPPMLFRLGGSTTDAAQGSCVDPAGNIYLCGYQLIASQTHGVIVKLDPTGTAILWAWKFTTNTADPSMTFYGIKATKSGHVYAVGLWRNASSVSLPIIIKLQASDGAFVWGSKGNTQSHGLWAGVDVDKDGNAYTAGDTWESSLVYTMTAKFAAATGAASWSRRYGNDANVAQDLAVDQATSDVYVANNAGTPKDAALLKYNTSGALQWQRAVGASSLSQTEQFNAVILASDGRLYAAGTLYDGTNGLLRAAVACYTTAGVFVWARWLGAIAGGSGGQSEFRGIAEVDNGIVVTGFAQQNNEDTIARFTFDGTLVWQKELKGNGRDNLRRVHRVGSNNILLTGDTDSPVGIGGTDMLSAIIKGDGTGLVGSYQGITLADTTYPSGTPTTTPVTPALTEQATANAWSATTSLATLGVVVAAPSLQLVPASPGVSYAKLNANDASGVSISNGGLTATRTAATGTTGGIVRADQGLSSGKFYFEYRFDTDASVAVGDARIFQSLTGAVGDSQSIGQYHALNQYKQGNSNTANAIGVPSVGAWAACAVDAGAKLIWWRNIGGLWNNNAAADPATGVGGIAVTHSGPAHYPIVQVLTLGSSITMNFGASAFQATPPAGFLPLSV